MTTTDDLRRTRPSRPRVVTIAVVLWAVWLVAGCCPPSWSRPPTA
ncbi:hypothetical protein P9139_03305 [Curtobacterium flaccumfaciens]|nr:hypothetical protein P9139_03305 [Curtobacterium flaccumfaciens]